MVGLPGAVLFKMSFCSQCNALSAKSQPAGLIETCSRHIGFEAAWSPNARSIASGCNYSPIENALRHRSRAFGRRGMG